LNNITPTINNINNNNNKNNNTTINKMSSDIVSVADPKISTN